jgi:hypothetical protein
MISKRHKTLKGIAVIVSLCIMQAYVLASPANAPATSPSNEGVVPQANGTIKTTNNQPVIVNGNSVQPGTTILSGSTIETPAGVGATVQLGFADLEITPGSEVGIEFTADGNVKVTLKRGCVILTTRNNAAGTIITTDGRTTEVRENDRFEVCYPERAASPVPATSGINKPLLALLFLGVSTAAIIAVLSNGGTNPSPSSP